MKTKVSYFKNVNDTKPKTIRLAEWLSDTMEPNKERKALILKYRMLKSKRLKLQIPCITVSATFKRKRNLDNIKQLSGLICLDIDRKTNLAADMALVKEIFVKNPSVMYSGYSLGNDGVYVIIKIYKEKKLLKYFNFFKDKLAAVGVNIDESCKDATRLRFFSIDEDAYYNPKATEFKLPKKVKRKKYSKTNASKTDTEKVDAVVKLIEDNAIDITGDYSDWILIAGALNSAFGDGGLAYFQRISKYHRDYKERTTRVKYESCQKMNKCTLSSFFHIATKHGVRY